MDYMASAKVGTWLEFDVYDRKEARGVRARITLIQRDGDALIMETRPIGGEAAPIRFTVGPQGASLLKGSIAPFGVEVRPDGSLMLRDEEHAVWRVRARSKVIGQERILTPLGRVRCAHTLYVFTLESDGRTPREGATLDVWSSDELPGGVAKAYTSTATTLRLAAWGGP